MKEMGYYNGQFVPASDPVICMNDRGYYFGDGVYEVVRVHKGRCFALSYHMDRLYRTMREMGIPVRMPPDELIETHEILVEQSEIQEGYIYLQITRDISPRQYAYTREVDPPMAMIIRELDEPVEELNEKGVKVITIPDIRWSRCDLSCLNLVPNVMGVQKAKEKRAYDAIQIRDGIITEACRSNVYAIKDGIVYTHPADNFILKGVTRVLMLTRVAPSAGVTVIERKFDKDFLLSCQEVFMTNAVCGIIPVIKIDREPVGEGVPGKVTRKLQTVYQHLFDEGLA